MTQWALVCGEEIRRIDIHDPVPQCDGSRRNIRPEQIAAAEAGDQDTLDRFAGFDLYPVVKLDSDPPPQHHAHFEWALTDGEVVGTPVYTPFSQEELDGIADEEERQQEEALLKDSWQTMNTIINNQNSSVQEVELAKAVKRIIRSSGLHE